MVVPEFGYVWIRNPLKTDQRTDGSAERTRGIEIFLRGYGYFLLNRAIFPRAFSPSCKESSGTALVILIGLCLVRCPGPGELGLATRLGS